MHTTAIYQFSIAEIEMKRAKFSLEEAQFTDDFRQGDIRFQYNQHKADPHDAMVSQKVHSFLADCKDIIERFISLSQFGMGFNLPFYKCTFTAFQQRFSNKRSHGSQPFSNITEVTDKSPFQILKQIQNEYEVLFESITRKMQNVIHQLLRLEHNYKVNCLKWGPVQESTFNPTCSTPIQSPMPFQKWEGPNEENSSDSLTLKGTQPGSLEKISYDEPEQLTIKKDCQLSRLKRKDSFFSPEKSMKQQMQQNSLKGILTEKLAPRIKLFGKKCSESQVFSCNAANLSTKLDSMLLQLNQCKKNQSQLIHIFESKRIKFQD